MFQTSEEVIQWIHERKILGMKPGLKRMEFLMERCGHPERRIRAVHIGGTNGKGSTTTFLRNILQEAGYEVGTFTSPYIEKFQERISINGEPISDEDLIRAANELKPYIDELEETEWGPPTVFEIITAIAFYYWGKIRLVDVVLVEVGLGGRLDSTNVIHPLLSIITNIGYDHMHILGSTLAEIAVEKAGIIKNSVPLVTGVKNEEAKDVITQIASEKKAKVYELGKDFSYEDLGPIERGETFAFQSIFSNFESLNTSLIGAHQIENASLAVMAASLLNTYYSFYIEDEAIEKGLQNAYWPGRFEIVSEKPLIILDGAHNKEGIESLVTTLKRHFPNKKGSLLFTALKDKQRENMIHALDELGYELYFTEFEHGRGSEANDLYQISNAHKKEIAVDWEQFLKEKINGIGEEEILVITGSLYFISKVKVKLNHLLKK